MDTHSLTNFIERARSEKVRLCIVTPNLAGGGAERIAVNLANYYTKKGVETTLIAIRGEGPYKSQINPEVKFIDLNVSRVRYSLRRIYKELKAQQPTHIISALRGSSIILGIIFSLNRKPKLIFREANTMDAIAKLKAPKRRRSIFRLKLTYLRANKIIANSPDTKVDLKKFKITHHKKIQVIPNPVLPYNYQKLANKPISDNWINNKKLKIILNVGRLHEQKNQRLLIKSFKYLIQMNKNLRLIILGDGQEKSNLLDLINNLKLNEFVKIVPFQENPWPYYKNADLFVLTSQWEGFGNVIVEALACGTPVISTDCPGGPAYILENGKYGRLVPPNDKGALQKEIMDVIDGRITFNKEELIQRGSEFSVDKIAQRYLQEILDT